MSSRYGDLISVLPPDWSVRPLSDVAERIVSGGTPSRVVRAYWNGEILWVTPGELTNLKGKYLSETRETISTRGLAASGATLLPPDSLMVTTRATLGSVALTARPTSTNQGFKSIVFAQYCDPSFYFYFSRMLLPELVRRSSGTTFPEVSAKQFGEIAVPVPPLAEQMRIAEILDTTDEAIRSAERLIAKLEQCRRGILHDLLTCGIGDNGHVRDIRQPSSKFTDPVLGRHPSRWEIRSFGALARYLNGYAFKPEDWVDTGYPIIRIQNLNGSSNFNYYDGPVHPNWLVLPGDLLFAWSGTRDSSFGPTIWRGPQGVLNQHIFKVHESEDRLIAAESFKLERLRLLKAGLMDDLLTGRVRVGASG
jgi:type I restriction enzyme, S subunit